MYLSAALALGCYVATTYAKAGTARFDVARTSSPYWTSNVTLGANHHQQMYVGNVGPDTRLGVKAYQPGSDSKRTQKTRKIPPYTAENPQPYALTVEYFEDTISVAGLSLDNAPILVIEKASPPPKHASFYTDIGILSMSAANGTFVSGLCAANKLSECRYGYALGTDGFGEIILGEMDSSLHDEYVRVVKDQAPPESAISSLRGNVMAAGKTYAENAFFTMSNNDPIIIGPYPTVKKMFKDLGVTKMKGTKAEELRGTWDCSKPAPEVGFSFPDIVDSTPNAGESFDPFNILGAVMKEKPLKDNTCEFPIMAYADTRGAGSKGQAWIIGSPFFEGRYVDFDVDHRTVSIATLKRPNGQSKAPKNSANNGKSASSIFQPLILAAALGLYYIF